MKRRWLLSLTVVGFLLFFVGCSAEGFPSADSNGPVCSQTDSEISVKKQWNADTFDGLTEKELQPYFDGILAFVEEYSQKVYSADATFFGTALPQTEQVRNYLNKKLEYQRIFGQVLGFTEDYVEGTYQILDWKSFGDTLVCKVAVTLRTRYSDTGTGSYSGKEVQIALQNPRDPHVSDWHIDDVKENPFETQVRGDGVDLFDSQHWLSHADQTALDQCIEDVLREQRDSAENLRRQREESLGD